MVTIKQIYDNVIDLFRTDRYNYWVIKNNIECLVYNNLYKWEEEANQKVINRIFPICLGLSYRYIFYTIHYHELNNACIV